MQHILIKFGLCHFVVVDDSTSFKRSFIAMCQTLNSHYDILTKRNHKDFTVEHFYPFLKRFTIATEVGGTNEIFVPTSIDADYTRNSTPINGTDIIRSIPALDRELHFTIDIYLHDILKMTQNNDHDALKYIKIAESSRNFPSSILKSLIQDHRKTYTERIKNIRNLIVLKVSDILMAREAI